MARPAQSKYSSINNSNGFRNEDLLLVSKAAEYLKVSASTLRNLANENKIEPIRMDNGYRYFKITDLDNLAKFLEVKQAEKKKVSYDHYIKPKRKQPRISISFDLNFSLDQIRAIKRLLAPELLFSGLIILGSVYLFNSIISGNFNKSISDKSKLIEWSEERRQRHSEIMKSLHQKKLLAK